MVKKNSIYNLDNENNSTKYWTKEKIGVYGWTVLHLIAARLPSKLTKDE